MSSLRYFAVYKPFQTLSQFSKEGDKRTLKDVFRVPKDVYPVGRLDYDSEGLLLLTNDPVINKRLLHPENAHKRVYWVQVDGGIDEAAMIKLTTGVEITVNGKKHFCKATKVMPLHGTPALPDRTPPIRFRKSIPAPWLAITLKEGKNRQVRKMCAAVGFPVLRLVRISIEGLEVKGWDAGEIRTFSRQELGRLLHID